MDLAASKLHAAERQLTAWTGAEDDVLSATLLLASDYIVERYSLKAEFTPTEQAKYDVAHFKIAYDFLTNGAPASRVDRTITKESKELSGVAKTSKEYADGEHDPYPGVTRLLAPLEASSKPATVSFGKLVR